MITLKCFNKKDLEEFVISGEYQSYDFLPITKHRALSQIKNPAASETDVLLTLVFDDEKLAAYLGSVPDVFAVENNTIKYAWLSTLYVNENFRGKRIAQQLLKKVFEKYEGKIALTEFTKEAGNLYDKTKKFEEISSKMGQKYYFRTDIETLIPRKKPTLSFLKPILKITDLLANGAISFRSKLATSKKVNFELSKNIDEESEKFLSGLTNNTMVHRLRWILENPWILEGKEPEKKYQFSSFSKEFNFYWVKIFDDHNVLKTVALLQTRNLNLKIPYLFSEEELGGFTVFLENFIQEKKIKTLISYHPELNKKLSSKKFPKLYRKPVERRYLFHKNLVESLPENYGPNYQDGDGDPVFT